MRRRDGFTLIELLVVIAIIGLLVSILVPSISKAKDLANRAKCQANLNGIGKAILMYQSLYGDAYPLISDVVGMNPKAEMIEGGDDEVWALDGDAAGQGTDLNINENLNVLVNADAVNSWGFFRCPQVSTQTMDRGDDDNNRFGFRDANGTYFFDYAYHMGYRNIGSSRDNAARFGPNLVGNFALLVDRPGMSVTEFGTNGEGYNHGDEGISVLYAGGNVQWSVKSIEAGWGNNNVYISDIDDEDNVDTNRGTSQPLSVHDSLCMEADISR